MWFILCLASILAIIFISLFILFVHFISKPNKIKLIYKKQEAALQLPQRLHLPFLRALPLILAFVGFSFLFIPLAPLLHFYEENKLYSLHRQLSFFLLVLLILILVALLYSSVKKSLSWVKQDTENE